MNQTQSCVPVLSWRSLSAVWTSAVRPLSASASSVIGPARRCGDTAATTDASASRHATASAIAVVAMRNVVRRRWASGRIGNPWRRARAGARSLRPIVARVARSVTEPLLPKVARAALGAGEPSPHRDAIPCRARPSESCRSRGDRGPAGLCRTGEARRS